MADRVPLVRVENAVKYFPAGLGASVKAVDGVSFEIYTGETLGLVGESGCGKSTLGRLITQLHPATSGNIFFEGIDLTKLSGEKLRQHRRQLQMIFQDPYSSLNPRMTVGDIIAEPLENFGMLRGKAKDKRVQELLKVVGLNPYFNNRYPHEFSGGQRQRIGIARALALRPKLIVCDEPISALDVSIQAQRRVVSLAGEIPSPVNPPSGCRFHTRCPIARAPGICSETEPPLEEKGREHRAACHFSAEVPAAV